MEGWKTQFEQFKLVVKNKSVENARQRASPCYYIQRLKLSALRQQVDRRESLLQAQSLRCQPSASQFSAPQASASSFPSNACAASSVSRGTRNSRWQNAPKNQTAFAPKLSIHRLRLFACFFFLLSYTDTSCVCIGMSGVCLCFVCGLHMAPIALRAHKRPHRTRLGVRKRAWRCTLVYSECHARRKCLAKV